LGPWRLSLSLGVGQARDKKGQIRLGKKLGMLLLSFIASSTIVFNRNNLFFHDPKSLARKILAKF